MCLCFYRVSDWRREWSGRKENGAECRVLFIYFLLLAVFIKLIHMLSLVISALKWLRILFWVSRTFSAITWLARWCVRSIVVMGVACIRSALYMHRALVHVEITRTRTIVSSGSTFYFCRASNRNRSGNNNNNNYRRPHPSQKNNKYTRMWIKSNGTNDSERWLAMAMTLMATVMTTTAINI